MSPTLPPRCALRLDEALAHDPLAAFVISSEACARASRTSLLPLYKAAKEASEANETAPRRLKLAEGKP